MRLGRYDESIEQYNEVFDLNPDNSVTLARIGQNYAFMGDFNEARRYYQKYNGQSEQTGQKLAALTFCAAANIAEGKVSDALARLDDYRILAEKNKMNLNMIMGKEYQGWIQLEFGDPALSIKEYEEAVNLVNSLDLPIYTKEIYDFYAHGWLCISLAANGKFEEAEDELINAKSLMEQSENPVLARAFHSYAGYLEMERGDFETAIKHFIQCSKDDAYYTYKLAYAYEKSGDLEEAQILYETLDSWENFGLNYAFARSLIDKDR
jgi:tetratricopeptide (TPR) repeat protein